MHKSSCKTLKSLSRLVSWSDEFEKRKNQKPRMQWEERKMFRNVIKELRKELDKSYEECSNSSNQYRVAKDKIEKIQAFGNLLTTPNFDCNQAIPHLDKEEHFKGRINAKSISLGLLGWGATAALFAALPFTGGATLIPGIAMATAMGYPSRHIVGRIPYVGAPFWKINELIFKVKPLERVLHYTSKITVFAAPAIGLIVGIAALSKGGGGSGGGMGGFGGGFGSGSGSGFGYCPIIWMNNPLGGIENFSPETPQIPLYPLMPEATGFNKDIAINRLRCMQQPDMQTQQPRFLQPEIWKEQPRFQQPGIPEGQTGFQQRRLVKYGGSFELKEREKGISKAQIPTRQMELQPYGAKGFQ